MAERDDDFLSRWSRRKGDAKTARLEVEPSGSDPMPGETDAAQESQVPDEAEIVAQLPDIESLDKESDFSVFMKQGVPAALRRRALRKLWTVNPVFSFLDGMNEYDEDYTMAASITEGVKTVYQVGKGMVREEEEEKPESEELAEAQSAEAMESDDSAATDLEPDPEPEVEGDDVEGRQDAEIDSSDSPAAIGAALPVDAVDQRREPRKEQSDGKSGGRSASQRRWGAFQT